MSRNFYRLDNGEKIHLVRKNTSRVTRYHDQRTIKDFMQKSRLCNKVLTYPTEGHKSSYMLNDVKMLNDFFPNVVENLDISECKFDDTFYRKTHLTSKVVLEYKRHPIAITFP